MFRKRLTKGNVYVPVFPGLISAANGLIPQSSKRLFAAAGNIGYGYSAIDSGIYVRDFKHRYDTLSSWCCVQHHNTGRCRFGNTDEISTSQVNDHIRSNEDFASASSGYENFKCIFNRWVRSCNTSCVELVDCLLLLETNEDLSCEPISLHGSSCDRPPSI